MSITAFCRVLFAAYALAIVTATHWPALKIGSHGINRLDLLIHAAAFGTWTLLCALCAFYGPRLSRRNITLSTLTALAYAVVDELSQGLPVLKRTVDPLDMAANASGILLAGAALLIISLATTPRPAADNN